MNVIDRRIVVIGGFTQKRYNGTGIFGLWKKLRQKHVSRTTDVTFHPWNDNWRAFAEMIRATGPDDLSKLDIRIVGYSWGVGAGVLTLAKELRGLGINVERVISCDGVYRNKFMLWRSVFSTHLLGQPRLVMPVNVKDVWLIRQRKSKPCGHMIVPEFPDKTSIKDLGYLEGRTHSDADDAPEFHLMALEGCL